MYRINLGETMAKFKIMIILLLAIVFHHSITYCQWIQSSVIVDTGYISAITAKDSTIFLGGLAP